MAIEKQVPEKTARFLWDGNVPLHEWSDGELTTWLFNGGFVLMAKLTFEGSNSIISDYLGTPAEACDADGKCVWLAELDNVFVPEGEKYHHQFRYRTDDGVEFSDLAEINALDLNKLPADDDSTDLWYWMKFMKLDDEEVLDMLATRSSQLKKSGRRSERTVG